MIGNFIDDNMGCLIVVFIIAVIGFAIWAGVTSTRAEKRKCEELLTYSTTHAESLQVRLKCEGPKETQYVPMPIYVPSR